MTIVRHPLVGTLGPVSTLSVATPVTAKADIQGRIAKVRLHKSFVGLDLWKKSALLKTYRKRGLLIISVQEQIPAVKILEAKLLKTQLHRFQMHLGHRRPRCVYPRATYTIYLTQRTKQSTFNVTSMEGLQSCLVLQEPNSTLPDKSVPVIPSARPRRSLQFPIRRTLENTTTAFMGQPI